MVECALIPPVSLLSYNRTQKYQLMLPHLLADPKYKRAYRSYAKGKDKYVILDNGAAEDVKTRPTKLLWLAKDYKVDEVVAPDVLGDYEGTITSTLMFLKMIENQRLKAKVGIVAQGSNIQEAMMCIAAIMRTKHNAKVDVVYLPRLLVTEFTPSARITLADAIHSRWPFLEIHFLGASRKWLQEPIAVHKQVPFVRSIDTSVPFTEAYYGRPLYKETHGMPRPDDYFEWTPPTGEGSELIKRNVGRYLGWTKGESIQQRTAKIVL